MYRRPPLDLLAASPFLADACRAHPELARCLGEGAGHWQPSPPPPPTDRQEAEYARLLRRWRQRELAAIAWQSLGGQSDLKETLHATSALADQALRAAHVAALPALTARYGRPRSASGELQSLVVLAMGKLGGAELNFSSDVDLIFLYPEAGETDGPRAISNEEFFTHLGRALIRLLDQVTAEGFVFRVDMRLRPFGDSGPLVSNFEALEDYLQSHGRDWERYAWIKARAITGADEYAALYRGVIRPFVYRRYLDFGVFESLREMKRLIEREVARRELAEHVKLGPGGIREIEFIVQSLQLIRGGLDERLQHSSLLAVLPQLAAVRALPAEVVERLGAAYEFLRRLENALQMRADEQTHQLPRDADRQAQLAAMLDLEDWDRLAERLAEHRAFVSAQFAALLFGGAAEDRSELAQLATVLASGDAAALGAALQSLHYADAESAAHWLIETLSSGALARLDASGRQRLQKLVPLLVSESAASSAPSTVLRRLLRLLERIGRRSSYFALLIEQAAARNRLVHLAGHGDFLIAQIEAYPLLLDELLDPALTAVPPTRATLTAELAERMSGVALDDEERVFAKLVQFQRAAVFRIAVADLERRLPLMQVSDRLTELAEVVLEQALALSRAYLAAQLGTPMCGRGDSRRAVRIAVAGYGKLGGMELGYVSDLDLVFLHDSAGEDQHTEGARSIDNQVYFVRFAQRVVHLLTLHSSAGRLYDVDMRLRPSGKGGMLITSIEAFGDYQRQEAWTWEHQALLHARAVAGDETLRQRFEALRLELLMHCVRRDSLRADVRAMRERQRRELSRAGPGEVDLKQDPGGIADIEFLAQYWALKFAADFPPVAHFADTIRQLESVASANLIEQAMVDVLTGAYRSYRERLHHRSLENAGAVLPASEFAAERQAVSAVWSAVMRL